MVTDSTSRATTTFLGALLFLSVFSLPAALTGQDTPVSVADANDIAAMLVDSVAPAGGTVARRALGDRPILLDLQRTRASFQALMGDGDAPSLDALDRVDRARTRDEAIVCEARTAEDGVRCTIEEDGFFVSIGAVERTGEPGEYRVEVLALWNRFQTVDDIPDGVRGEGALQGYRMETFVAPVDGTWRVTRYGVARAIN